MLADHCQVTGPFPVAAVPNVTGVPFGGAVTVNVAVPAAFWLTVPLPFGDVVILTAFPGPPIAWICAIARLCRLSSVRSRSARRSARPAAAVPFAVVTVVVEAFAVLVVALTVFARARVPSPLW